MNMDAMIMSVFAERDAAREETAKVRREAKESLEHIMRSWQQKQARISRLEEQLKEAESKVLPEACDTKRIIDAITLEANRANNRRAELEEKQCVMDSTLHGLTVQLQTLKADYERAIAENAILRDSNRKLETALGLLDE